MKRQTSAKSDQDINRRRAQESFGFMIAIGSALITFLIFAQIINNDADSSIKIQELTKLRTINEQIARAVYNTYLSGPGSETRIYLEKTSTNYTILIRAGNTILMSDLGSITNPTRANLVIDSEITCCEVLIKNEEGLINVTQI